MKPFAKIVLTLFVILYAIEISAGELPETPAGKRASEVVAFLNGASSLDLDDYIQNQYDPGFRDVFSLAAHKAIFQTTQTIAGHAYRWRVFNGGRSFEIRYGASKL
jgi:hypothetical protein